MSLNILAVQLGELGRREEALAVAEEDVGTNRQLAAAHPDAFRPELARSLNNLAIRLGELGRREEALAAIQEAVTIRQELADRWPDAHQHELQRSRQIAARLEHGKTSATSPCGSLGSDNGPLSLPPAKAFVPLARRRHVHPIVVALHGSNGGCFSISGLKNVTT